MTGEELKKKCKERARIFQQVMESCKSLSPIDCIEWFADRIAELERRNEKMKQDLDNARENANKQEQWEIYSVLNDIYNDNFEVVTSVSN